MQCFFYPFGDGATVEKDHIYLAPPNHNIAKINKTLHYQPQEKVLCASPIYRGGAKDDGGGRRFPHLHMEKRKKHFNLQIFASDIDAEAIEFARKAVYPESISADVSSERLARYFTKRNPGYYVKRSIRESVIFALQDFARDPPFSRLDLISSRNVLIYMDQILQK